MMNKDRCIHGKASAFIVVLLTSCLLLGHTITPARKLQVAKPPNILLVISDDQSYPHASAYGYKAIATPSFDRVAKGGVLFTNAIVASPGCSPSRAALLTGRNCWQIEEAATHASSFSTKYQVYPDILEDAGYIVGSTGKGWGPGNWQISGRKRNPAGTEYNAVTLKDNPKGISSTDYAGNFEAFLSAKDKNKPFCFWLGGREPHRDFDKGIGVRNGKSMNPVSVPAFLPDDITIKSDLADYLFEIEWLDRQLGKALDLLEKSGELANTIVVVTADNGMAFPRAKANVYEYGIHVPLAIMWQAKFPASRVVNTPVSLIDLAPTFLEAAGIQSSLQYPMAGISLLNILMGKKDQQLASRAGVYSSRERHSSSRWNNLGYPQRALRTGNYLYIKNLVPDRWPAGDPRKYEMNIKTGKMELGPEHGGYHDIDAAPSLDHLVEGRDNPAITRFFHLAVDKRPAEELYDIIKDPACLHNLVEVPRFKKTRDKLKAAMEKYLIETGDPRSAGKDEMVEAYPRYEGVMREFPKPE